MDILSISLAILLIVVLWRFRKPITSFVTISDNRANYMVKEQELSLGKDWHKLQSKLESADLSDEKSYNKAFKARVEASQTTTTSSTSNDTSENS